MAEAADGAESIDAAAGVDSQCAGSPITRARKNLAALEALAAAEERGSATAEEIAAMEAYSGWGGAQKAFSENAEGEWGEIRDRLKELLSDDEFASQRHTVLTAFYTPAPVIGAIYDALREAGIGHGDTPAAILEPGCGTGNFMRLAPADLALDFHGVELDPISARIAQALCPEAHITAAGLEECRVSPASFDAAIGNVPYSGDIKIDGISTRDMKREEVRSQFCMVLQDTWLFEGTVRENLVYNTENVSEEKIEAACKAVGLDHFIRTLPHGYDTILNDQVSLSQGQKQQLTIARAMIADKPMLILDEATSSVDTRTELQIQKAMDALMQNRTSFVIAHRLSTIKNADLILVLKDGDIIESGNHEELLAKGGFYADLYNSQFDQAS